MKTLDAITVVCCVAALTGLATLNVDATLLALAVVAWMAGCFAAGLAMGKGLEWALDRLTAPVGECGTND